MAIYSGPRNLLNTIPSQRARRPQGMMQSPMQQRRQQIQSGPGQASATQGSSRELMQQMQQRQQGMTPQQGMGTGLAGMTPQQIQQLQSQTQPQTSPGMSAGMMNDLASHRAQFQNNEGGPQQMAAFQQNAMNQGQPQQMQARPGIGMGLSGPGQASATPGANLELMQQMQQMQQSMPPQMQQQNMMQQPMSAQAMKAGFLNQPTQGMGQSSPGMGTGLAGMGQPQPSMGTGLAGMTPQQIQQLQAQTQQQTPPGMSAGMMNDLASHRAQFQNNEGGPQQMAAFQQNAMNQGRPQQGMTPPQQGLTAQAMKAGFASQPQQPAPAQNPVQQGIGSLPAQASAPAAAKPAGMF